MQALEIKIVGKVQGVFFRKNIQEIANKLNLTGWIRNLDDGSLKIITQGEQEDLDSLVNYCKVGPEKADIKDIQIEEVELDNNLNGFEIKY